MACFAKKLANGYAPPCATTCKTLLLNLPIWQLCLDLSAVRALYHARLGLEGLVSLSASTMRTNINPPAFKQVKSHAES